MPGSAIHFEIYLLPCRASQNNNTVLVMSMVMTWSQQEDVTRTSVIKTISTQTYITGAWAFGENTNRNVLKSTLNLV